MRQLCHQIQTRTVLAALAALVVALLFASASWANGIEHVTVEVEGSGTGTVVSVPPGINCPPTCEADFLDESEVTLVALPAADAVLQVWGGDCSDSVPCVLTMDGPKSATAVFLLFDYDLW